MDSKGRHLYQATYCDGISADAKTVTLVFEAEGFISIIHEQAELDRAPLETVSYSPAVGRAPLVLRLPSGALVEVPHDRELAKQLLRLAAKGERLIGLIESRRSLIALLFALSCSLLAVLYLWGLPAFVSLVQPLIPFAAKEQAGEMVLSFLDDHLLSPSRIAPEDRRKLEDLTTALCLHSGLQICPILLTRRLHAFEFKNRETAEDIANAFALLPTTIVVSDKLFARLTLEEVEAVIAHEMGHLAHDDGTNLLLRSSFLAAISLFTFGPDPGIAQTIALTLAQASYSQEQEWAADRFAAELLMRLGKNPESLAHALRKLAESASELPGERYISSHPLTSERIETLMKFREAG